MHLTRTRLARAGGTLLSAAVLASIITPTAAAAPATWTFSLSSVATGARSGGELAIDPGQRRLFVTDNDYFLVAKGGSFAPNFRALQPKVIKFDIDRKRPVGRIDYTGQPWGLTPVGPVRLLPTPQIPDGIGVDTVNGRVITANTHADGITVTSTTARTTSAADLRTVPNGHPMGVATDGALHRAYVAMNAKNYVSVLDTRSRREVKRITGLFAASLLDVDQSRHRLYVGNADYQQKKNNFIAVIDTRTDRIVKKIAVPSNSRPKVDPATGRIFAASYDTGKISVIDPDSLKVVATVDGRSTPNKLAIDGQRRLVYAANLQKKTVTVIDADTFRVHKTIPVGAVIHTLAVDPKTGTVYGTQMQGPKLTVLTPSRT